MLAHLKIIPTKIFPVCGKVFSVESKKTQELKMLSVSIPDCQSQFARNSQLCATKGSHHVRKVQFFLTLFKRGGGVKPMFKNYVGNCRVFWRSFNNMKFAWKGTFEAFMVKCKGKMGTLYQNFTPCNPSTSWLRKSILNIRSSKFK